MESDFIVGIYEYFEASEVQEAGYYLVHLFANNDSVELAPIEETANEVLLKGVIQHHNSRIGPFENLSEMNQFAFGMCEKTFVDWVGTISVKEYNQILETVNTIEDYKLQLISHLNVMENINKKTRAPSIIKKIFS